MALSANRLIPNTLQPNPDGGGFVYTYGVLTSTTIYEGGFVTLNASGHARPLNTSDSKFVGIAGEFVASGAAASGVKKVKTFSGVCIQHAITSITPASINLPVYASADDTLTLVSTSNVAVGWVQDVPATGVAIVLLKKPGMPIS